MNLWWVNTGDLSTDDLREAILKAFPKRVGDLGEDTRHVAFIGKEEYGYDDSSETENAQQRRLRGIQAEAGRAIDDAIARARSAGGDNLYQSGGWQPPFFSALTRAAEEAKQEKTTVDQWRAVLTKGTKKEETAATGRARTCRHPPGGANALP